MSRALTGPDNAAQEPIWVRMMRVPWGLTLAPHMTDLRTHIVRRHARSFEHRRKMGAIGGRLGSEHVGLERPQRTLNIIENALMVRPLGKKNCQHRFQRHQPPLELRPKFINRMCRHVSSSLVSISEDYRRRMSRRQQLSLRGPDVARMYAAFCARRQA